MAEARSDAFVFFGATGDLGQKQIFPALAGLTARGELDMPVIAVARSLENHEQFLALVRRSLEAHGAFDAGVFERLASRLTFVSGDYQDPSTFARLARALGDARHPLHYLAIPPSLFGLVSDSLAAAGLAAGARVIVEKPFGRSLASARELNRQLHASFDEQAIFRIDHYLGKEPVQNLLYFRFANTFLEPVWNAKYIARVSITMSEQFGVGSRGAFYEEVGAVRDVVQNHLLQILALTAMEPPRDGSTAAIHEARTDALEAVAPLTADAVWFGQYRGYRREPHVAPDSQVETFAAVRCRVDTPRWQGVPFIIRAGKCLAATLAEVSVEFKDPPHHVFCESDAAGPNRVTFRLQPQVFTAIDARAKVPGEAMRGEATTLIADAAEAHNGHAHGPALSPYERLIGDALDGERTLFTTERGVEAAWRVVDPVVHAGIPVHDYEPGTDAADLGKEITDAL